MHIIHRSRTALGRGLAAGVVVAAAVSFAPAAGAHVGTVESEVVADSYTVVTFAVPHGCDESATTRVRISVDPALAAVTPTVNPNWDLETVAAQAPTEGDHGDHGAISEVIYTAKQPLPAHFRDTFELQIRVPDAAGTSLTFPVVQECEQGTASWTQIAAEGQDPHELDYPAAVVNIVADNAGEGHGADSDDGADDGADVAADAGSDDSDDATVSGITVVTFILAVTGVIGAGIALIIALRKSDDSTSTTT